MAGEQQRRALGPGAGRIEFRDLLGEFLDLVRLAGPGGEAALKAIGADATRDKGARAEAVYQLTSLAAGAGKADEVKKLAEEVAKLDPTSTWAQRATLLLTSQPTAAQPAATDTPALSFKPGGE